MSVTRILLSTGGTGGHVFPALATAEAIRKRAPKAEILFIGTAHGPERRWVEAAAGEIRYEGLAVKGLLGRGIAAVPSAFALGRATLRALGLIRAFKPQVVGCFGGYACVPAGIAARLQSVPLAVHEQNAIPGAATALISRIADKVLLSLPGSREQFPGAEHRERFTLTGNPVREEIAALATRERRKSTSNLLVLGGSQGAKALNEAVVRALPGLLDEGVVIRHQTGPAHLDEVRAAYRAAKADPAMAVDFIADMAQAYRWADLVLCRSGASTVAELTVAAVPAFFVPFPHAVHDHQRKNAEAVVLAGGGLLIPQDDLANRDLAAEIVAVLTDRERLARMQAGARSLARPEAARQVAHELLTLIRPTS